MERGIHILSSRSGYVGEESHVAFIIPPATGAIVNSTPVEREYMVSSADSVLVLLFFPQAHMMENEMS